MPQNLYKDIDFEAKKIYKLLSGKFFKKIS